MGFFLHLNCCFLYVVVAVIINPPYSVSYFISLSSYTCWETFSRIIPSIKINIQKDASKWLSRVLSHPSPPVEAEKNVLKTLRTLHCLSESQALEQLPVNPRWNLQQPGVCSCCPLFRECQVGMRRVSHGHRGPFPAHGSRNEAGSMQGRKAALLFAWGFIPFCLQDFSRDSCWKFSCFIVD